MHYTIKKVALKAGTQQATSPQMQPLRGDQLPSA